MHQRELVALWSIWGLSGASMGAEGCQEGGRSGRPDGRPGSWWLWLHCGEGGERVRRSYGFVVSAGSGMAASSMEGRQWGHLPWDGCSSGHSYVPFSSMEPLCWSLGLGQHCCSGNFCVYAAWTLLLIQPFVFQVVKKTFVYRVLRDDWIENAVLICLFIKHRALVCHEMTGIPLLMRIQGNKKRFTSTNGSCSCWVRCSSTYLFGYKCKFQRL